MVPGGPLIGAVRPVDAGLGGAPRMTLPVATWPRSWGWGTSRGPWPFPFAWRPRLLAANHQDQVTAAYLDGH